MNVLHRRSVSLAAACVLVVAACGGSTPSSSPPAAATNNATTVPPTVVVATPTAQQTTGATTTPTSPATSVVPSVPAESVTPTATACTPATPPAAPSSKVTLNLWIFEGEDQIVPTFISDFQSTHPNIELKETLVPEDLYSTKMETAFAAGTPPDIAFVYNPTWMKAGDFLPINDLMASNCVDISQFAQTALSSCQVNDTLYCIGSYTGLYVLYYDKSLFDAAGLSYPSGTTGMSVDTYAQLASQLAKPNSDLSKRIWGATTGGPEADVDNRDFVSPDGKTASGYFDSAANINTFAKLAHMANDGSGLSWDDIASMGVDDAFELMKTHQLAMTPDDNTALPNLEAAGIDVGVAPPFKEQDSDPFWIPMWTDAWGVTTKSAHPDEAKQFLTWVATEGQKVRADSGALPLNIQYATQIDWAGSDPGKQDMVTMAEMGRPFLFVPGFADNLSPIIDDTWNQVVNDEANAESIMHSQVQVFQTQLTQDWATWDSIQ